MIGTIRGILIEKAATEVLIEAAGIGYEVQIPLTSLMRLPDIGSPIVVFTHFVVREDAQLLFGFADKQERSLFKELIKANGVGPKMALTIMSGMSASQFAKAVHDGDLTALVKLPGIGKKTAERLLVEMKDRLKSIAVSPNDHNNESQSATTPTANEASKAIKEDAIVALVALGYKRYNAEKMVLQIYQPHLSSEELIREALKQAL